MTRGQWIEGSAVHDLTLRYMPRFHCLGAACEETCCRGWRVVMDKASYEKMKAATDPSEAEREWFGRSVKLVKNAERALDSWAEFKMQRDGTCPMLLDSGLCRIHTIYGEDHLCNACMSYPRRVYRMGDMLGDETDSLESPETRSAEYPAASCAVGLEVSAVPSCPEVARLLLLHEDAVDILPCDRSFLPPLVCNPGIDLGNRRPYWHYLEEVRDRMGEVVRMRELPLQTRLLCMVYIASRTTAILNHRLIEPDSPAILDEIRLLEDRPRLEEVASRFDRVKVPLSLVVLLAKALLSYEVGGKDRTYLRDLTRAVFTSYLPGRSHLRRSTPRANLIDNLGHEHLWTEYEARKARVLEAAPARINQYFTNYAANYLFHKWQLEATNLLVHMIRLLVELAVQKLMLFSHPQIHQALDQIEAARSGKRTGRRKKPETGRDRIGSVPDDAGFLEVLDRIAVEVAYRTTSKLEHGYLLEHIEKALKKKKLLSSAGAVYLAKL